MRSGFFDSEITGYDGAGMPIFDRAESAAFFARYFSRFLDTGVYAEPEDGLLVTPGEGLAVRVLPGYCYIEGYMGWQESAQDLGLSPCTEGERHDGVLLRLSLQTREVTLTVQEGFTELTRTGDTYELLLAEVHVPAGSTPAPVVIDKRADPEVCGFVSGLNQVTSLQNAVIGLTAEMECKADKALDYPATISTSWSGSVPPFTQIVSLSGITSTMSPLISPVYSTNNATALLQKEAWGLVSKAVTGSGNITFSCFEEKPITAIPILIKVVN